MRCLGFVLSASAFVCLSGAASGADLQPMRPYAAPAPAYISPAPNWTGWYLGGNFGYGWGGGDSKASVPGFSTDTGTFAGIVDTPGLSSKRANSIDGWFGGVQTGYNWQLAPSWLIGVETDFQRAGQKGALNKSDDFASSILTPDAGVGLGDCPCPVTGSSSLRYETNLQWFGTARGRVGFNTNSMMFYGTGGLAYGRFQVNGKSSASVSVADDNGINIFSDSASNTFSKTQWKAGWALGAGVEGVAWDPRWTWRVEYLYLDFGKLNTRADSAAGDSVNISTRFTDHLLRTGVNYRF